MTRRYSVKGLKVIIQDNKRIRGWLLVLCIALAFVRSFIITLGIFLLFYYEGLAVSILLSALGSVGGVLAAVMLWSKIRHAVTFAKIYLVIQPYIVIGILAIGGIMREPVTDLSPIGVYLLLYFQAVLGALIWFPYLTFSKRVKNIYQVKEKKPSIVIAFLVAAAVVVLLPFIILIIANP